MTAARRLVALAAVIVLGLGWLPGGAHPQQHGEEDGHLDPVRRNVELVGKLDLFGDDEQPGRISDVAAFGNYVYLGAFWEPDCQNGGVYIVDISDPSDPQEVGFIPASPEAYVGEGVQVLDIDTEHFTGQVLIHNNENCFSGAGPVPAGRGGVSLWDVTDPLNPSPLALHVGDTDPAPAGSLNQSQPHQTHSAFGWQQGDRAYVVMTDNVELGNTDIDILDITDPANPEFVTETGFDDFPEIMEDPPPNGANAFHHDVVVKQVGNQFLMLVSYWDGGYLILDATNLPEMPTLLRYTNFGPVEPFAAEMGLPDDWTPEGNAHQAEFNHDSTLFLGADEDFNPYRIAGIVESGRHEGDSFSATMGSDVPGIDPDSPIEGKTRFVGEACAPVPPDPEATIALIERGTCTFTIKLQNVQNAGYEAGIVFNDALTDEPQCDAQVFMLAVGDIPFMFAGRSTGLKLLDQEFEDACDPHDVVPGTLGTDVSLAAIFDGWGYLHLYDAQTMEALDHWALPEAIDPAKATGFGDLSIHEVATDPTRNIAYISHYSGGFRVVEFSRENGIQEVGAFIDAGGNNFWGVEVHAVGGEQLILASDRDSGLYIFRYPSKGACPVGEVPPSAFTDIAGNTHEAAIECLVWRGITVGLTDTTYGPTQPVRRDQMASFLARTIEAAGGALPDAADHGFTDVEGNTHEERISQLAAVGVVRGTTETTYSPGAAVTRAQMATFLVRAYQYATGETLSATRDYFTDDNGNAHEPNINNAAEAGFTTGTSETTYSPAASVRRDQMASFLTRLLDRALGGT